MERWRKLEAVDLSDFTCVMLWRHEVNWRILLIKRNCGKSRIYRKRRGTSRNGESPVPGIRREMSLGGGGRPQEHTVHGGVQGGEHQASVGR